MIAMRTRWIWVFVILSVNANAAVYSVGPGQPYEELGSLPWMTLAPGDTVRIHWRSKPYASKIFLRVSGTPENPIVIRGIPNENGDLPVLSGENATTDPQFIGYFSRQWTEDLGLFLIHRNTRVPPVDEESYKPKHIIFEYLEITGVKPSNTFIDQDGKTRNYNRFSSAIHALEVENLTIRYCKIHDNAQGIFTNTNDGGEGYISRNILIEYNEIWGNGNADDNGIEHNIYTQAAGTIIQFNRMGSLRPGSRGANIKDRSSGTIIRYNWIEGSARLLDLVETEGGWRIILNEPNYHDVYVYGNIFVNDMTNDPFGVNMIHFGFDNDPELAKRGTLYFYHNTIFIKGDKENFWYVKVFDVTDDNDPATTEGRVNLYNNIVHKEGTTQLTLMRDGGTLYFYANNWLYEDYDELGYGATAEINYIVNPILGSDPGFTDASAGDFTLTRSSPAVDRSHSLPAHIVSNYPLTKEYVKHADSKDRTLSGTAFDLGALEYEGVTGLGNEDNDNPIIPFQLFDNYPNPFNPATTIAYRLFQPGWVELTVYNLQGMVVANPVSEYQEAGRHSAFFNADHLPGGVYFYRLRVGNLSEVKKMVLLK